MSIPQVEQAPLPINIRLATEADLDLLAELDRQIFTREFDNNFTREQFAEYLERCDIHIVCTNDQPIGYYFYENLSDEEAELVGGGGLPQYQSRGLGQKIMQAMLHELRGKKRLILVTHPKNTHAIKLYEKMGFVIKEEKENYYGDGQPRILMVKEQNIE